VGVTGRGRLARLAATYADGINVAFASVAVARRVFETVDRVSAEQGGSRVRRSYALRAGHPDRLVDDLVGVVDRLALDTVFIQVERPSDAYLVERVGFGCSCSPRQVRTAYRRCAGITTSQRYPRAARAN
jgi:hypothetical protein